MVNCLSSHKLVFVFGCSCGETLYWPVNGSVVLHLVLCPYCGGKN